MAKFPALPLWTDAYLADTTHLTTEQHGAYLLLLMTAWRRPNCDLPDDDKFLAAICKCDGRKWVHLRSVLAQFFQIADGVWVQNRLVKESKFVAEHSRKMRENVSVRWNKNKDLKDTNVIPSAYQADAPTPTPIPPISPKTPVASKKEETPIGVHAVPPRRPAAHRRVPWWDEYRTSTNEGGCAAIADDWPADEEEVLAKLARAKNATVPVDRWRADWLTACANLRAKGMSFLGVQACSTPGWKISEAAILAAELAVKERAQAENSLH